MINDFFKALKDIDQFLNAPNHLEPGKEGLIRMIFGEDRRVPIIADIQKLDTTEEVMNRAGEKVLRMQEKGLLTLSDKADTPEDVFKRTMFTQKMKEVSEKPRADQPIIHPISTEPFQKFWLTSHIVIKTVQEIRSLPCYDTYSRYELEQKFIDQVSSVTRIMNHEGLLNEKETSKKQLYQRMNHFVTETLKIRTSLIGGFVNNGKIIFKELSKEAQKEFENYLPNKNDVASLQATGGKASTTSKDDKEIDINIINHINTGTNKLPSLYTVTDFNTDERSRVRTRKTMRQTINMTKNALNKAMNQRPSTTINPKHLTKGIGESQESDQHQSSSTRPKANIITTPFLGQRNIYSKSQNVFHNVPKLTEREVRSMFWKENDPLISDRTGQYVDQLEKFEDFTGEVELDGALFDITQIELPFKLTTVEQDDEKPIVNRPKKYAPVVPSQTLSEIAGINPFKAEENDKKDENNDKESQEEEENNEENNEDKDNNCDSNNEGDDEQQKKHDGLSRVRSEHVDKMNKMFSTSVKMGDNKVVKYSIGNKNRNDMVYLHRQTQDMKIEKGGSDIHSRLDQIWESLGFTIIQKLDMVVKYSRDAEESSKLSEALILWEKALAVAEQYESTYTALKDFLKLEGTSSIRVPMILSDMKVEYNKAIESLNQVASNLRQSFNDELIIRRKTVLQIISEHKIKLRLLCRELNIVYDNV